MNDMVRRGRSAAVLVAVAMTLVATAVPAQTVDLRTRTTRGIGLSASLPDALAGAGAWQFFGSSRIGIFAEAKTTLPSLESDDNYCPEALATCSVSWVLANRNDFRVNTEDEWLILNAGAMYAVSPQFALQLGAGMARSTRFHKFIDDAPQQQECITWECNYYVSEEPVWQAQAVGGVLMHISRRIAFTFGFETATSGMAIGAYLVF